jgi:hypothetical protein
MRRDFSLRFRRRFGTDHIAERLIGRGALKPSSFPISEIVLHAPLYGPAKDNPWFPHGPWHDANAVELLVCIFRSVAAAHRHGQPHDGAAQFQSALRHRGSNDVRQQGIACHNDIRTGDDRLREQPCQLFEEIVQFAAVFDVEDGETR